MTVTERNKLNEEVLCVPVEEKEKEINILFVF